ncbi:MAG: hypothetical protein JW860_11785 [Sedimentisphaerales bacterium]|nr:hypothetical protein [Sedimentisphaerales bacterium]
MKNPEVMALCETMAKLLREAEEALEDDPDVTRKNADKAYLKSIEILRAIGYDNKAGFDVATDLLLDYPTRLSARNYVAKIKKTINNIIDKIPPEYQLPKL